MADRYSEWRATQYAGKQSVMSTNSTNRPLVGELADEFLARYRRGERPSLTEYVQRFPEYSDEIREVFPGLAMLEDFGHELPAGSRQGHGRNNAEALGVQDPPLTLPRASP